MFLRLLDGYAAVSLRADLLCGQSLQSVCKRHLMAHSLFLIGMHVLCDPTGLPFLDLHRVCRQLARLDDLIHSQAQKHHLLDDNTECHPHLCTLPQDSRHQRRSEYQRLNCVPMGQWSC